MNRHLDSLPLLLSVLASLSNAQWRCLRVVSEVGDVAHAARKLHCSQARLKEALADLQVCVGAQHLSLQDERVQLSSVLQDLVRRPCSSGNVAVGIKPTTVLSPVKAINGP